MWFARQHISLLLKRALLLKDRICSVWEQFFSFYSGLLFRMEVIILKELSPLKVYPSGASFSFFRRKGNKFERIAFLWKWIHFLYVMQHETNGAYFICGQWWPRSVCIFAKSDWALIALLQNWWILESTSKPEKSVIRLCWHTGWSGPSGCFHIDKAVFPFSIKPYSHIV